MTKCYICEQEITQPNTYNEHIILHAIGGKLKSKNLICRKCSPDFDSIDTELADQLNLITCHLNVKRERNNKIPSTKATIIATGEEIFIEPGGQPVYKDKPPKRIGEFYNFQTRNSSKLRKPMKGVARKVDWLDVDEYMKIVEQKIETGEIPTQEYINSPIEQQLRLGGEKFWRSICKMAINFYMYNQGERRYITHLIPFIKQGIMRKAHLYWYYPESNIFPDLIGQNKVIHALTVHGNPKEKILYSVIHLYSTFQFIVLLNDNYQGDEINHSYLFDVITSKNISDDYSVNNRLTKAEVQKTLDDLLFPESRCLKKVNKLFGFIFEKQRFDRLNKLNKQTIDEIYSRVPKGEVITEKDCKELLYRLASNFTETLLIQRQKRLH